VTVAVQGQRIAFGGFGSSSPLVNVRDGFWYRDDFISASLSTFGLGGGGANSSGNTAVGHAGVYDHTVTAVADRTSLTSANLQSFPFGSGIAWMCEWMIRIATLSDAVNRASWRFGFGDVAGADQTDGAYFEQDLATYGDQFWRMCTAANGVRTKTATTVAPTAGAWTRLTVSIDAQATLASFQIDGVSVGSVNTNIPTTGGVRSTGYIAQMIKTLGAGGLSHNTDYVEVIGTFATRR
jgi:hypothetical protein